MDKTVVGTWVVFDLITLAVLVAAVPFAIRSILRTIGDRRREAVAVATIGAVIVATLARDAFKMSVTSSALYTVFLLMGATAQLGALLWLNRRTAKWQGTGFGRSFAQFGLGWFLSLLLGTMPNSLGTPSRGADRGPSSASLFAVFSLLGIATVQASSGLMRQLRASVAASRTDGVPQRPTRSAQIALLVFAALFAASGVTTLAHGLVWLAVARFLIAALLTSTPLFVRRPVPAYVKALTAGVVFSSIGVSMLEQLRADSRRPPASTVHLVYGLSAAFAFIGVAQVGSAVQARRRDRLPESVTLDLAALRDAKYAVADLLLRAGEQEHGIGIINGRYLDRYTCRRKLDARDVVEARPAVRETPDK